MENVFIVMSMGGGNPPKYQQVKLTFQCWNEQVNQLRVLVSSHHYQAVNIPGPVPTPLELTF